MWGGGGAGRDGVDDRERGNVVSEGSCEGLGGGWGATQNAR